MIKRLEDYYKDLSYIVDLHNNPPTMGIAPSEVFDSRNNYLAPFQPAEGGDEPEPPEPEYVDLGLSVLWAKCNLGAEKESDYGNYYAWGEIEQHDGWPEDRSTYPYSWDYYKFGYPMTKYNTTDQLVTLEKNDDAVSVVFGNGWRMPTSNEWDELKSSSNTSKEWVENYNDTGVKGCLFTSLINGNTLFIPASGYYAESRVGSIGGHAYLWTSSIDYPREQKPFEYAISFDIYFNSVGGYAGAYSTPRYRFVGQPVRPVKPKNS